jgi:hypothetical protein
MFFRSVSLLLLLDEETHLLFLTLFRAIYWNEGIDECVSSRKNCFTFFLTAGSKFISYSTIYQTEFVIFERTSTHTTAQ